MIGSNLFTSEAVTAGHPDKLCDQISDAIVDSFLTSDRAARINAECAVAHGVIFIAASYAANSSIDIPEVARTVIKDVGYETGEFNAADCSVLTASVNCRPISVSITRAMNRTIRTSMRSPSVTRSPHLVMPAAIPKH